MSVCSLDCMHILVVSVPGTIGTYARDTVDLAGFGDAVAVPMDNCSAAAKRSWSSSSMMPSLSLCSLALAMKIQRMIGRIVERATTWQQKQQPHCSK